MAGEWQRCFFLPCAPSKPGHQARPITKSLLPLPSNPTKHHGQSCGSLKLFLCTSFVSSPYRPRASPLWQIVHHSWADFLAEYESRHRRTLGPLRHIARATVAAFSRCGDLAAGFTRLHCPDCGHQRLLAFTCKGRHFCPACHQRRVLVTGDWIARSLCRPVPHRPFVFTMPRPLRGIFRKRRELLQRLFRTAVDIIDIPPPGTAV